MKFQVSVDEIEVPGLGVLSQGEIRALALCLFLPRACAADSPFRFVVIDDPVQAMDPAKVDGLARVLDGVAATRQVVVFTHDNRLREAVERLDMPATVIEVTRGQNSSVRLRRARDPIRQCVDDAFAVITDAAIPDAVQRRVVGGYLRAAIEAACMRAIRRRRLSDGVPHADVEAAILAAPKLWHRLALALFDDADKHVAVADRIRSMSSSATVDSLQQLNKGSHHALDGDLRALARSVESLAPKIAQLG